MDNYVIEVKSVFGQITFCSVQTWEHIVSGHQVMKDKMGQITQSVSDPDFVYESKSHPTNRDIYFRYDRSDKEYTKVIVQNKESFSEIVSAWPQDEIAGNIGGLKYVRPRL